jgi:translation initiation factor 3 subunit C
LCSLATLSILTSPEFDKLVRFVARHQTLTSTLPPAAQTPALFIKSIIDMDAQITETAKKEKDSKKKMNAANAKGLNGMKQKVKKQLREFENAVNEYKKVGSLRFDERLLEGRC